MTTVWSAPVRYVEVDGQGVVFNAHYLVWCDEAMSRFCREHDLLTMAENVRVVRSALVWTSSARWGDLVEVTVAPLRLGRTSFALAFHVRVGERTCCEVETTYVSTDHQGRPLPLTDRERAALDPAGP